MADGWVARSATVANRLGLHARPAGLLTAATAGLDAELRVAANGKDVDGRSVVSLLTLAATQGTALRVRARGPDAEAALAAFCRLLASGFDED